MERFGARWSPSVTMRLRELSDKLVSFRQIFGFIDLAQDSSSRKSRAETQRTQRNAPKRKERWDEAAGTGFRVTWLRRHRDSGSECIVVDETEAAGDQADAEFAVSRMLHFDIT